MKIKKRLIICFSVYILIRLVFMPVSFNYDLTAPYYRSYLTFFSQEKTAKIDPPAPFMIHSLNLKIISAVSPGALNVISNFSGSQKKIAQNPDIFLTLFLLKLPYLIFDIGAFFLLYFLFNDKKHSFVSMWFYALFPVNIFATFIYGRYESMAIFLFLLTIILFKHQRYYLSAIAAAVGYSTRPYFLIFLAFYFFLQIPFKKRAVMIIIFPLTSFLLKIIFKQFVYADAGKSALESYKYLFMHSINGLYPVFIALAFAFFYCLTQNRNLTFEFLTKSVFIILCVFFAFINFAPNYFAWLVPVFAVCFIYKELRFPVIASFFMFCVYTAAWEQDMFGRLFLPLDPEFFYYLPSPKKIIEILTKMPASYAINTARSVNAGILCYIAYKISKLNLKEIA